MKKESTRGKKNNKGKVVVTGGSGFIGSYLVKALVKMGYEVHTIDRTAQKNLYPGVILHQADICDINTIKPIINGSVFVFHLAGIAGEHISVKDPVKSHNSNVNGTLNVLIASNEAKVKRLIYSSSSSVYGNQDLSPLNEKMIPHPKSPYALHKYMGELYCKLWSELYKLPTVSLRYFSVYGPRIHENKGGTFVIDQFLKNKKEGKTHYIIGNGSQTRDFVHVYDVVLANILAMKSKSVGSGEILNVGTGRNVSINFLSKLIGGTKKHIPLDKSRPQDTLADISRVEKLIGWKPKITLETGLDELKKIWKL